MKRRLITICSILMVIALSGCAATQTPSDLDSRMSVIEKQESEMLATQKMLSDKEQTLKARETMVNQKEFQINENSSMNKETAGSAELLPPGAKPGECYARIFMPSQYEYKTESVLKHDAKEDVVIIPAKYQKVEEKVLVKEASKKLEMIPAKYEMIEEKMLISPEKRELVAVPAKYETITEKVLIRDEHVEWKKGTGPIQKVDESTGEIMCLVKEPAVYKTVTKRVLKEGSSTKEVALPAEYKTISKRVMVSPPETRVIEIPASFKTVKVTKLVEPAKTEIKTTPAEYQTVTRKVMVSPGHLEWQQILCQTNMTNTRISQIQSSLRNLGYDPGPIDGVIGAKTMAAVNKYQSAKALPATKYLTFETLQSLGVTP